jgi:hypothetical protein
VVFFICLITSWVEIGNGKKMLLSILTKYSYFKPVFNYTRKGLWKGSLICQNCDTLICFHPNAKCGGNFHIVELEVCQSCTYMTMFSHD